MERNMTITGDEKRMADESPRGSLEKLVNMKTKRSPPVKATRNIKNTIFGLLVPRNDSLLYIAIPPMITNCKTPLMITTWMESISFINLSILEYVVIRTPEIKAKRRPRDLLQHP